MPTHVIVLAAGAGTRMLSDRPKVLHEIGGTSILAHVLSSAEALDGERVLVVGRDGEAVRKESLKADGKIRIAEQSEQRGTAHAVTVAAPELDGKGGDTLVLLGDTPFIRPETISDMSEARADGADIVFLGFETSDPGRYGRIVTDGETLQKVVEWRDADAATRALTLCNAGLVLAETGTLLRLAAAAGRDNAAGEHYLTDIAALGRADGLDVRVVTCAEEEALGINTCADLARAESVFQARARNAAIERGVTLHSPDTVHFAFDTRIDGNVVVEPSVVFGPGVVIESGARIRAFSHLEGCHVGRDAVVGPHARLRPGTELGTGAHIGNFVEAKNAEIREGAQVKHLSYIGDASIGRASNVGAGTITCNYDGVSKHRTEIGENAFIGSSTMLVAPVTVGNEAMTASGSVITRNVPDGDLAIARGRQKNRPGFARKLMARLRASKGAGKAK
ncbi:MAG: bifunctional UDP-N-acetylglucosamine diphosphorylase/glucosamine-1-phosphate N-acetyltransferase GlmU [Boseongicola sp. SB0664_bin_43]|uniref:Bifunctional protein GlmU n=1 Tax=Boseongicola sp. SB0664_bin_43 TaxID=2604844 RepID=A0A6B0Y5X2_9RHOB|nr:bifunctional UDP-N-acetylglucosamine diphosphorylase/glucosamine-1-phosphate N-acetyltransferase GlmU [Boseongicola sp. SB0664_bin_43]MYK30941.1 bifunctional UDP-N-acetylglucosamine diphosphorylase/glucosamine-1-phosphate N-acetyltransferase GlmU [Boseongicola sp. SB0670_bin_30]